MGTCGCSGTALLGGEGAACPRGELNPPLCGAGLWLRLRAPPALGWKAACCRQALGSCDSLLACLKAAKGRDHGAWMAACCRQARKRGLWEGPRLSMSPGRSRSMLQAGWAL